MNAPSSPIPATTRRSFLKQSTLAGGMVLGFPSVLRAANPNGNIHVAAVGVGGMGGFDVRSISAHDRVRYVGFCDVDTTLFDRVDEALPGVRHFRDFRAMLDELGDTVDAINVGTPDHTHAWISIEAMKRGKHVYCQKPPAQTVWEARQMRLWAEKKNVVTQMGNQVHSAIEYRLATRLIKEGAIGKVREVHSWVGNWGNQFTRLLAPPAPTPAPAHLDWNLWLGCVPLCEYTDAYHPFTWRDWQKFGGGALGDFGCHILDPVFTALGLKAPVSVAGENTGINRHVWPAAETIHYVFPGNELTAGRTLNVTWTDGGRRPERKLARLPADLDLPRSGSLFIGEVGNLVLPHVGGPRLYPQEKFREFAYPKDLKGMNHWHRWIDAILTRAKTSDGFDYAGLLTETVQLGNVATRVVRRPPNRRLTSNRGVAEPAPVGWTRRG